MAHDVFISYSTQDKAFADAVCAKLEQLKLRCWIAPRDIIPGEDWGESIIDAIGGAKVMVLIFSNHSNNSLHVRREVQNAVQDGLAILPLRIEDVPPVKSLRYFLGTQHWLDAVTPPLESHLDKLCATVAALLEPPDTSGRHESKRIAAADQFPDAHDELKRSAETKSFFDGELLRKQTDLVSSSSKPPTPLPRNEVRNKLPADQCIATFQGHTDAVWGAELTAKDSQLISASYNKVSSNGLMLRTWDVSSKTCVDTFQADGHTSPVTAMTATLDGTCALSGSKDQTIRIWDTAAKARIATLIGHRAPVTSIEVTADGTRVLSASEDRTLKIWDLSRRECIDTLEGHADAISAVAMTADGTCAISASGDRTLRVWDLVHNECTDTLQQDYAWTSSVALTPDGRHAATAYFNVKTVTIWDLKTATCMATLEGHLGPVNVVALTADGTRVISGSSDKTIRIWDIATGACIASLNGHTGPVLSIAPASDGTRAFSGSADRTVKMWDLSTL